MLPHYVCDSDMDNAFATAFSLCSEQCLFLGLSWINLDQRLVKMSSVVLSNKRANHERSCSQFVKQDFCFAHLHLHPHPQFGAAHANDLRNDELREL